MVLASFKSQNLKFQFRQIADRAKYSFLNCIGIIRIDLSESGSSNNRDIYTITADVRVVLDEGLKMTSPVKPGSTTTKGERKKKAAEQAEDAAGYREGLQPPRMDLKRPGARGAQGAPRWWMRATSAYSRNVL